MICNIFFSCSEIKIIMERNNIRRLIFILLLGQLVSLSLSVSSFTSSLIANLGTDTPLTQSFFAYLSVSVVYGAVFLFRGQKLLVPWYWYTLVALVDVLGNYLVVKAYQYSSITSVTLLDCWVIPWVVILTWFALGTRYSIWQFFGAGICVVGLCLVLFSDSHSSSGGGTRPLLGDALVIIGTVCYAFSNVGEEFCVKRKDRIEVITMLAVFEAIISALGILVFERHDLESVKWSPTMISLFVGFAAASFVFYTTMPLVLKMSGATLFNLSLLTADMWAVAIRIFFYHQQVNWLYCLAFVIVIIGLVIYSLNENSSITEMTSIEEASAIQYQQLDEQSDASYNQNGSLA